LYQLILSFSDKLPQIYPHSRCQAVFIRFLISMLYRLIRLFPYVSASQGHLYDLMTSVPVAGFSLLHFMACQAEFTSFPYSKL
jgi:hypothetical protein